MAEKRTKASPPKRRILTAQELIQEVGVSISGLTFYKYAAAIADDYVGGVPDDLEPRPEYELLVRQGGAEISARLRTIVRTSMGVAECDVAVNYATPEAIEIEPAALEEFANNVALMAVLPYVREAIAALTLRVFGQALVMPVIQRGQLSFVLPVDESDDADSSLTSESSSD